MERAEELRKKVVGVLVPWGVKRIALFGSTARGEEGVDSDVDILVELKGPSSRPPIGLRWFALEQELGRLLGREVELVSADALSPYLRSQVEAEMVVLYEEE